MSNTQVMVLGTGALTWPVNERRSDRYGCVFVMDETHTSLTTVLSPSLINADMVQRLGGFHGRLVVKVLRTRKSTHVGDLARQIFPRTPTVGAEIVLGEGYLFAQRAPDGGLAVGVSPIDQRRVDWMNPRALYDAHEQIVELQFQPVQAP